MKEILDAILSSDSQAADFAALPLPEAYRAVTLHRDEEHMFDGIDAGGRDPRESLHVEEVPVPELGLGEALIAVMASAVNYNTVWSSIFSPISTFSFLRRYGRLSELTARHDLPYQVVGSDLAGVVLRTGPGVNIWKPGEEVVAHCLSSSWRVPTATTTPCSTRSSASGASRRTSAASPSWPSSRPTS